MSDSIKVIADKEDIDAIANAVRSRNGTAGQMTLSGIITGINNIGDIVSVEQATPSLSITNSTGVVTATSTQSAGKVSAGTKTSTYQLTTKSAATYTPTTSNQTISAYRWLTGAQTIKGDANLVASNIKSGISIFGVAGTLQSGGVDTCSVTVTLSGKTITMIGHTAGSSGNPQWSVLTNVGVSSVTMPYVVCNSIIQVISLNTFSSPSYTATDSGLIYMTMDSYGKTLFIRAGLSAGASGTITIYG